MYHRLNVNNDDIPFLVSAPCYERELLFFIFYFFILSFTPQLIHIPFMAVKLLDLERDYLDRLNGVESVRNKE